MMIRNLVFFIVTLAFLSCKKEQPFLETDYSDFDVESYISEIFGDSAEYLHYSVDGPMLTVAYHIDVLKKEEHLESCTICFWDSTFNMFETHSNVDVKKNYLTYKDFFKKYPYIKKPIIDENLY